MTILIRAKCGGYTVGLPGRGSRFRELRTGDVSCFSWGSQPRISA